MISKKSMEDVEIGDLVILPVDPEREFRSVVSTEASQVFGERKCGYYIMVRGLTETYFGYEDEQIPFLEPEEEIDG